MRYEGLEVGKGESSCSGTFVSCLDPAGQASTREKERENETTTYFVDTMGHKCVATGPVDIRQADCSLSLLRPIVGSSGPAEPPAGRALFPDDGLVINDEFAGAAENQETSLTIRDRSRIMHASLFRLVVSLNMTHEYVIKRRR